jgi:WD40 repeat protein
MVAEANVATVRLWDTSNRPEFGEPPLAYAPTVFKLAAFDPLLKLLAVENLAGNVQLWSVAKQRPLCGLFDDHTKQVRALCLSPGGKILASATEDRTVRIWQVENHQPVGKPLQGHAGPVSTLVFSSDGKLLASGAQDGTIRLWDPVNARSLGNALRGHKFGITELSFSTDGRLLASGAEDGTLRLWDVARHRAVGPAMCASFEVGQTCANLEVGSLAFSPDGGILVSAAAEGFRVWDTATQQPVGQRLIGHSETILSVAFSRDGKTLASAGFDRTVRLWDVATWQPLGEPLKGYSGYVLKVAFTLDNNALASVSSDGVIRLWDVSLDSWIARACKRANRNLSLPEWRHYVHNAACDRTCPTLLDGCEVSAK